MRRTAPAVPRVRRSARAAIFLVVLLVGAVSTVAASAAVQAAGSAAVSATSANLALAKTASRSSAPVGDTITYTLRVTNAGPDAAEAVTISDWLPSEVDYLSASAGCAEDSGQVACTLGTLASGSAASKTITVRIGSANDDGEIVNYADAASETEDPDSSDNNASATIAVPPVVRPTADAIAAAITQGSASVTGATFVTAPPSNVPYLVSQTPLASFPTHGSTYGILTTGDATLAPRPNSSGSSGAIAGGGNVRGDTDFDVTILKIDLAVPAEANCLSLDFRFLSEEFPEYVDSPYNDAFVAELDTSTWTTAGSAISAPNNFAFDPAGDVISINASGVTSMNDANAAGTTYDGATPLLRASTPLTPGAHVLYLSIFDQGDSRYDSAVFLDDLVLGSTAAGTCVRGATPLFTTKTADDATTTAGGQNGYTITVHNPTSSPATLSAIKDELPDGFSYVPGSSSGPTTADPAVSGRTLTWNGPFSLAANATVSLHFRATVSSVAGEYLNTATAEAGATPVTPASETAKVTVIGGPQMRALTVSREGTGAGTVTSSPAGINCGATCSASFADGTAVTLVASAASGSTFGGWGGACSGTSATCTVTMDAAKTVTATFTRITRTLTVSTTGTGAGTVTSSPAGIDCGQTCSAGFDAGATVTLTATAASGSSFAGWSGACSGTSATCTLTMDAAKSVTATFDTSGGPSGTNGFTTVRGTDVVSAGFGGMRDDGTGTLTVSGVTGQVTRAYLYWHGPTMSTSPAANASVRFAGSAVVGTNIGFSSDNCWGYANSQAYRANVTALVSGDGTYALAGFVKESGNVNVNGASLIVFFQDGNAGNDRDIVLFDGNDSNIENEYDGPGWDVTLAGIAYAGGRAGLDLHVSDGQTFEDDAVEVNGATIAPAGPVFQGDSVPNGPNDRNGGLWDIAQFDITSRLTQGPNTLRLTSGYASDCLSLIVAAVSLPSGAAPPTTDLAIDDVRLPEGGPDGTTDFTFTLTRTGPTNLTSRVGYATVDGTALSGEDYEPATGTVTFAPGETAKAVTVRAIADSVSEPDETFSVVLSNPQNASIARDRGVGTIVNDDGARHDLTVTRTGTGAGTVTSSPAGISCGQTCSAGFDAGTTVTLTASAASGSSFAEWSGACSGTSPTCTVTLDAAKSVTASFTTVVPPENKAPSCANVSASRIRLWPPDHTFRLVRVRGGTDPDGDPVTLSIRKLTQDEPVRGLGTGDKAPDAVRVSGHPDRVKLRAERRGTGDGRVYRIKVRGSDGRGATCGKVVKVGVPHDLTHPARDSGRTYNSFG